MTHFGEVISFSGILITHFDIILDLLNDLFCIIVMDLFLYLSFLCTLRSFCSPVFKLIDSFLGCVKFTDEPMKAFFIVIMVFLTSCLILILS